MSHEHADDHPIAIANCDEAAARAALGAGLQKPLQMFFLELPSGWLWLRVEDASLEYLYSLKLCSHTLVDADVGASGRGSSMVLDLVADPALLEKFSDGRADIVYWRRSCSSEVDRRSWQTLSQWLEARFSPPQL